MPPRSAVLVGAARWGLAAAVAIITGAWSATALFSNTLAGLSPWMFGLVIAGTHLVPALLIGLLVPKRWYFALVAAWGGIAIDSIPLMLFLFVRPDGYPTGSYRGSPAMGFGLIPITLLVGAYVAQRYGRRGAKRLA